MIGLRLPIAISGWLLVCGCSREGEHLQSGRGEPEQAVRDYFAAIARRDCPALERSVAEAAARAVAEHGCERVFEEFVEHGIELEGIESVVVDGRDARVRLVRARVREGGVSKVVMIGVRGIEGKWMVVRI